MFTKRSLKNMKKNKGYKVAIIGIFVLLLMLTGLVANKVTDIKYNGKVLVSNVTVTPKTSENKVNTEVTEVKNTNVISGYDTVKYTIKYKLETDDKREISGRTAVIEASLSKEDIKYATWNTVSSNKVSSEIINEGKTLQITVKDITTNKGYEIDATLNITGAPNNYNVSPIVSVKEETSEEVKKSAGSLNVQTTSVSGTVVNNETNNSEENVALSICKIDDAGCINKKVTYSNSDGSYTFSNLTSGTYNVSVEDSNYESLKTQIEVKDGNNESNVTVTPSKLFKATIKKYIKKVYVTENGQTKEYDYDKVNQIALAVKNMANSHIQAIYEFEISNNSEKAGYVKVIRENIPEGMELDPTYQDNNSWKQVDGILYNKSLSTLPLQVGSTVKLTVGLKTKSTTLAQSYVNIVELLGETYHNVNYIVDETTVKQLTVLDTDLIYEEAIPDKTGHKILGWYTDKEGKNKYNFDSPVLNDINLYATYEKDKFDVTFNNKLKDYELTEEVEYGDTVEEPDKDNKVDGYTFKCWQKLDDTNKDSVVLKENYDETKCYDFETPVTEELDLIAVYTRNYYNVKFMNKDDEDKYVNYQEPMVVEHGTLISAPTPEPTKEGYTFVGWYESEDEGKTLKETSFNFLEGITRDTTLYSKFDKDTVYFDVTFIVQNNSDIVKVEQNTKVAKPNNPNIQGYRFINWYESEDGGVTLLDAPFDFDTLINKDTTIVAKLVEADINVTFKDTDENGGQEYPEYNTSVEYNTPVDRPLTDPVKPCLEFKYWSLYESGLDSEGNEAPFDFSTLLTTNTTLYAIFEEKEVKVTYVDKGQELTDEDLENIKCGDVIPLENPNICDDPNGCVCDNQNGCKGDDQFECWRDAENPSVCIPEDIKLTKDITLVSSYIKLPTPVITHLPTEWTNQNVMVTMNFPTDVKKVRKISTKTVSEDGTIVYGVTEEQTEEDLVLTSDKYEMNYQVVSEKAYSDETTNFEPYILSNTWNTYSESFEQEKNSIVVGKILVKDTKEKGENLEHQITNIDKKAPEIISLEAIEIRATSFKVKVKALDLQSGTNIIKIFVDDSEEPIYTEVYDTNLRSEKILTYKISGLTALTDYTVRVEVTDLATNTAISENLDVTTTEGTIDYVAQIIGVDGTLYETTEEYRLFATLEEAVEECGYSQCTIQMIRDTQESVDILEGKDITLDLNGKTVLGTEDSSYTIQNYGNFIVVDNSTDESIGSIVSTTGVAINNISGVLQIGEGEESGDEVSKVRPYILGNTKGIDSEADCEFKFLDGVIEGIVAIEGEVTLTPFAHNPSVKLSDNNTQVATLSVLAEPEARIGTTYYTRLLTAIDEAEDGSYGNIKTPAKLGQNLTNELSYSTDMFVYDEENNTITSQGDYVKNSITIDLFEYEKNQLLSFEPHLKSNYYTHTCRTILYDLTNGTTETLSTLYYQSDELNGKKVTKVLIKGNKYKLEFDYVNSYETQDPNAYYQIRNLSLADYDTENIEFDLSTDLVSPSEYKFNYDSATGKLISNNQDVDESTAHSYLVADLTDEAETKTIKINAEISSEDGLDVGYVTVTNSPTMPEYYDDEGRQVYLTGEIAADDYEITLLPGQINYIHFGYYKDSSDYLGTDTFTINSIGNINDVLTLGQSTNNYYEIEYYPILNEEISTVEIIRDVTTLNDIIIPETQEMILDLNGYELTSSIENNGNLTIIDSKYDSEHEQAMQEYYKEQASYDSEYSNEQALYDSEYESTLKSAENNSFTSESYIQDNLKVQLDGLNPGETEGQWSNLSNNETNAIISEASWNENALTFDGTNDYVNVGEHNYDNVTLETIFSNDELQTGEVEIGANYEDGGYGLSIESGYIEAIVNIGGTYYTVTSTSILDFGEKYHATLTYDGKILKLYVNGILEGSKEVEGTITTPASSTIFALGANPSGTEITGSYFKGKIYSFRIYDSALTQSQIQTNFNIDNSRFELGKEYIHKQAVHKQAEKPILTHTGKVISSSDVIINNKNAVLKINDSQIETSGSSKIVIKNYGDFSYNDNVVITSSGNGTGIYNYGTLGSAAASLENLSSGIIINSEGSFKIQDIKMSNVRYGIENLLATDIEISNVDIGATSRALFDKVSTENIVIKNSIMNGGIYAVNQKNIKIIDSNINGEVYVFSSELQISNSNITSSDSNRYALMTNATLVNIQNSVISSDYKYACYMSSGSCGDDVAAIYISSPENSTINIKNSNIKTSGNTGVLIYNNAILNLSENTKIDISTIYNRMDSTIGVALKMANGVANISDLEINSVGKGITTSNTATVNIKDSKINTTYEAVKNAGTTTFNDTNTISPISVNNNNGIINTGIINIYDEFEMKIGYKNGINNSNVLNVGKNDETVKTNYPIISGSTYSIYDTTGFNYFDGKLIGQKDKSLYAIVSETLENYDLKVETNDTTETITLESYEQKTKNEDYAAKIGNTNYVSLKEAISQALTTGDEIILLKNIRSIHNNVIGKNQDITLDLAGYVVNSYNINPAIQNTGKLNIKDSTTVESDGIIVEGAGKIFGVNAKKVIENNGTLTLTSGTIDNTSLINDFIDNYGTFNMIGGVISDANNTEVEVNNILNNENATFTVTGGTLNKHTMGTMIANNGTATFENATFVSKSIWSYYSAHTINIIHNTSSGNITIDSTIQSISSCGTSSGCGIVTLLNNDGVADVKNITYTLNKVGTSVINSGTMTADSITVRGISNNAPGSANIKNSSIVNFSNNKDGEIISTAKFENSNISNGINNYGTLDFISGNLSCSNYNCYAVRNYSGTFNLGKQGDVDDNGNLIVSQENPLVSGRNAGIYNYDEAIFNFYDGRIKATTAIYGGVDSTELGYTVKLETIDSVENAYLDQVKVAQIIDSEGNVKSEYLTFSEAIEAYTDSTDTIKIIDDTLSLGTDAIIIEENENITIDLNGKKIVSSNEIFISNLGTLNIFDNTASGSIVGESGSYIENKGNLNVVDSTITQINNVSATSLNVEGGTITSIINSVDESLEENEIGTITISDSTISNHLDNSGNYTLELKDSNIKTITNPSGIVNMDNVTANGYTSNGIISETTIKNSTVSEMRLIMSDTTIENGKITLENNSIHELYVNYAKVYIKSGTITRYLRNYKGNIAIDDITIRNTSGKSGEDTAISNLGIITIENGTISSVYGEALFNDEGTFTLKDGTISSTYSYAIYFDDGTINIEKGSIISETTTAISSRYPSSGIINIGINDGNMDINTPIIRGNNMGVDATDYTTTSILNFYDGKIYGVSRVSYIPIQLIESGYTIIESTETVNEKEYKVRYLGNSELVELSSTGESYTTLQEAIDAASENDTIKLMRDYIIDTSISQSNVGSDKKITLDLNGKYIETAFTEDPSIWVDGTLKIIDTSEETDVNNEFITFYDNYMMNGNGTIEVNSGNITGEKPIASQGTFNMTGGYVQNLFIYGVANINSGSIGTINSLLETSQVNVNDGTITDIYIYEGEVIVNNGTISYIRSLNNGTTISIQINNGIVNKIDTKYSNSLIIQNGQLRKVTSGGITHIYGGTFIGDTTYSVYVNNGKTTVTGGIFEGQYGIYVGAVLDFGGNIDISIDGNNPYFYSYATGEITLHDIDITANQTIVSQNGYKSYYNKSYHYFYGTLILNNVNLTCTSDCITNATDSGDSVYVYENNTITSTNAAISNGVVYIGNNDGVVNVTSPVITGGTYGVNASNIYYYDGKLIGADKQSYTGNVTIPEKYRVRSLTTDGIEETILIPLGEDEQAIMMNGSNYSTLEDAIAAVPATGVQTIMKLYRNIGLTQDIVIPAGKNILIVTGDYQIEYNGFTISGDGTWSIVTEETSTTSSDGLLGTIRALLNIDEPTNVKKNIVIYESDNGELLESGYTYELQMLIDDKYEKVDVTETLNNVGRYKIATKESDDVMVPINGRIYINDIPDGNYRLVGTDNKVVTFTITSDGSLTGNIKENHTSNLTNVMSSASAEIIANIRTGNNVVKYGLIITILSILIVGLVMLNRKRRSL